MVSFDKTRKPKHFFSLPQYQYLCCECLYFKLLKNHKIFKYLPVIQWLNKQITETQLTQQRVGTFENPGATSNFRPSSSALVSH